MGLRDRDYTQNNFSNKKKRRKPQTNGGSATVNLIIINVALWFVNGLFFAKNNALTELLLLRVKGIGLETCYQFLTYGFVHSSEDWTHIVFNMIGLLMFGYGMMLGIGPGGFGFVRGGNVEDRLGKREFIAFYLLTIIIGGIAFVMINASAPRASVLGASGGVCGVVILYAWLFPRKTLLFMGIVPMPMWCLGLLLVFMDAHGAALRPNGGIAYSVHLAGAACGTLYYFLFLKKGMKLTDWLKFSLPQSQRKPNLRIHTPEEPPSDSLADDEFNQLLDDILKRYGEVGEAGLTPEEREFLQRASRKFSEKHRK